MLKKIPILSQNAKKDFKPRPYYAKKIITKEVNMAKSYPNLGQYAYAKLVLSSWDKYFWLLV